MMRYSVQAANQTLVKGYGFLFFAKNMDKNIGKNFVVNIVRNLLIMLQNLQQMHLKLLQKEQFKKQQKLITGNNIAGTAAKPCDGKSRKF